MKKNFCKAVALLCCALLAICALPSGARADAVDVDEEAAFWAGVAAGGTGVRLVCDIALTSAGSVMQPVYLNGCTLSVPAGTTFCASVSGGSLSAGGGVNNSGTMGSGLTVTGSIYNTGTLDGVTCSGNVYNDGGDLADVTCAGTIYSRITIALPSGVSVQNVNGYTGFSQISADDYWVSIGALPISFVTGTDGRKYARSGNSYYAEYSISYYYNDGKNTRMKSLADEYQYPSSYLEGESVKISAAPDQAGYAFDYWTCGGVQGRKLTLVKPTGDLKIYSSWKESASAGKSGGAATQNGSMTGGKTVGGPSAAAGAASVAGDSDTDDADDETTATATTTQFGQNGGMRVRTASSVQRHTFTSTQSSEDIEALANSRRSASRFPWQWIGVGLGGALILFALFVSIRRRLNERNAATLEKLNIHD